MKTSTAKEIKKVNSWFRNVIDRMPSSALDVLLFVVAFSGLGTWLLTSTHAATPTASFEAENGTISSAASNVLDTTASSNHAVKFGSGSGGGTANCQAPANKPGGPDGLGGCFPGAFNTGYPHGLAGDTRTPVTLTNYTGSCSITVNNTVIDSKNINNCSADGLFIYAQNVTIKN